MTAGISAKFNRRSRNACTATSLAALSDGRLAARRPAPPPAPAPGSGTARSPARRNRAAPSGSGRGILHRRRGAPATQAHGRWACACPASRAARAPSRRRIRPASARCSARWTTTSTCAGSRPNSRQASMSSRPLFMSVAESTEILRPITQFGCAQACSGVACVERLARPVEERAAGGGEQDAPHARAAPRPRACLGGRHWKIALCSLSIGSSVAPEARTRCSSSGPAMTSDSLLASSRRLPARAAASVDAQARRRRRSPP